MNAVCRPPELAIIVPTFNEAGNVAAVVERVAACMGDRDWELVFVDDDSPDATAQAVRALGRDDRRVRCVQRIGRRGLSSACIEGILSTTAPVVAVMDADLQHDERLLPQMLQELKSENLDVVVGSRYVSGEGTPGWSRNRVRISRLATVFGQRFLAVDIKDPMSGFFMMTREAFDDTVRQLSGIGFKILLDILASSRRRLKVRELPFTFRERHSGESKLDSGVAWDYVMLLMDKTVGRYVPVRFIVFSLVGGLGVLVHMLTLALLFKGLGAGFAASQLTATLVAMSGNFFLNNYLTYRDRRLRGMKMIGGLLSFILACSVGAVANVGIAVYLFEADTFWVLSAVAGVIVGAVWNYAVSAVYTWNAASR